MTDIGYNTKTPDGWVLVSFYLERKKIVKCFASWNGGYLHGDYWRLNSGVDNVSAIEHGWIISGAKSSTKYELYKNRYDFISGYNRTILLGMIQEKEVQKHDPVIMLEEEAFAFLDERASD